MTTGLTGLLVDYGGVLTTSVTRSFRAFCDDVGLPPDLVRQTFVEAYHTPAGEGPVHLVETGKLSGEEFAVGLAEALSRQAGIPVEPGGLLERLFARVQLEERMLGAVLQARQAGVRTGLLSNSWGRDGYPRARFGELFDAVVISGEVGVRKPDPAIYRLAADRLGLEPTQCVFVDDLAANVKAAEAVGMTALVHRRPEETIPHLADLLGVEIAA